MENNKKKKLSLKRIKKVLYSLWQDLNKYFIILPKNLQILQDDENAWYMKAKIIPHACGQIGSDIYTNSKEAFELFYKQGIKAFEIDLLFTSDNVPVLAHEIEENITFNEFMANKIKGKYTPLSLENIVNYMEKDSELHFLLDSKNDETVKICQFLKENHSQFLDRFIIQLGKVKDFINVMNVHEFKYIHWNFSVDRNLNQHFAFVIKNNIHTCSVAPRSVKKAKSMQYINKFNLKAYAYTINTKEQRDMLLEKGCWGVISDNCLMS